MKQVLAIFLIYFLMSCNPDKISTGGYCYLNDSTISDINGNRKDSNAFFIPTHLCKDSIRVFSGVDSLNLAYWSLLYSYFNESIYYNYYQGEERFRLLVAPSYKPNPYLITIFRKKNDYFLQCKYLKCHNKQIHSEFTKLASIDKTIFVKDETLQVLNKIKINGTKYLLFDTTIHISKKAWDQFKDKINSAHFWNTKPYDYSPPAIDGTDWIIEGQSEHKYWFVINKAGIVFSYLDKLFPVVDYINQSKNNL